MICPLCDREMDELINHLAIKAYYCFACDVGTDGISFIYPASDFTKITAPKYTPEEMLKIKKMKAFI